MQPSYRIPNPIISLNDTEVDFDGYKALKSLNIDFPKGGVQFIIGPNGAGKTTVLDAICGKVNTSKGKIIYNQTKEVQNLKPEQIVLLGISRKFQNPTIFTSQTVWENLKLSIISGKKGYWYLFNRKITSEQKQKMEEILIQTELIDFKDEISGSLSHGQKQWLEIAMSIVNSPELLLVDEPIAGMTPSERERTGELLKTLGKQYTVFIVEHDMNFVEKYADSVLVMHEGRILCRGSYKEISENPEVIEVYLGRTE